MLSVQWVARDQPSVQYDCYVSRLVRSGDVVCSEMQEQRVRLCVCVGGLVMEERPDSGVGRRRQGTS